MELDDGFKAHIANGGVIVFLTLTLRHSSVDSLRSTFGLVADSWRQLLSGRAGQALRASEGVTGFVRSTELTYGANGWHPHLHIALFVDQEHVDSCGPAFIKRWREMVTRLGGTTHANGQLSVVATKLPELARYMVAADESPDGFPLALELSRADLKTRGDGMSPMQLATLVAAAECAPLLRVLWWEYEQVTRGRRAIEWSRGLRHALRLQDIASDADAADGPEAGNVRAVEGRTVMLVEISVWFDLCAVPGATARFLERLDITALERQENGLPAAAFLDTGRQKANLGRLASRYKSPLRAR